MAAAPDPTPRISVIVTTYNNPRYLEMVLMGYARQDTDAFEVVVADDGSKEPTRELLDRLRPDYPVPLIHAWQEDAGFRQARAMSWGVLHSRGEQLVFTDGDCVPQRDMVSQHLAAAAPDTLVVGGHIRLDQATSDQLDAAAIQRGAHEALVTPAHRREMRRWHRKNSWYILIGSKRRPKIFGLNMALSRETFLKFNGLDLNYENNARQDSDLRNRMRKGGAKARCIWHKCIPVHLWHPEHTGRNGDPQIEAYYHRKDLAPVCENGIRQLAEATGRTEWLQPSSSVSA